MTKLALTLAAGAALLGAASAAQAHEWGSGYGYGDGPGYGHSRVIVREGYRDGYRGVRFGHREWDRPGVRVIERRGYGHGHRNDWDD